MALCNTSREYSGTETATRRAMKGEETYRGGYTVAMESKKAKCQLIKAKCHQIKAKYQHMKANYERMYAKCEQVFVKHEQISAEYNTSVSDQHAKNKTESGIVAKKTNNW